VLPLPGCQRGGAWQAAAASRSPGGRCRGCRSRGRGSGSRCLGLGCRTGFGRHLPQPPEVHGLAAALGLVRTSLHQAPGRPSAGVSDPDAAARADCGACCAVCVLCQAYCGRPARSMRGSVCRTEPAPQGGRTAAAGKHLFVKLPGLGAERAPPQPHARPWQLLRRRVLAGGEGAQRRQQVVDRAGVCRAPSVAITPRTLAPLHPTAAAARTGRRRLATRTVAMHRPPGSP
jgi:hypothetical protein